MAELAAGLGWEASEANHILVVDAATVDAWPLPSPGAVAVRPAVDGDAALLAALHDAEFPDTYASAERIVSSAIFS